MVHCEFEESCTNGSDGCGSCNYSSYMLNNWTQIAESTMPLKTSKLAAIQGSFQASVEHRSREISKKLILVNLISLLINLLLAVVGFYFSFVNNSPSTTAFATDCILDFISSAIVLWRYYGDLNSVYMHAREQIACIYLGALFEISALAIIIKASNDMASGSGADASEPIGYDLVYLASAATVACTILTVFKCALYKTIRDNSILLDVINTLISTVFAVSIIMSQALINVNPSFWYLDPILSIVLALFMAAFGIKVIHQNFNILRPVYCSSSNGQSPAANSLVAAGFNNGPSCAHDNQALLPTRQQQANSSIGRQRSNYDVNLNTSVDYSRANWQKTDYSTISFV